MGSPRLYRPFDYLAGSRALSFGIASLFIISVIAYYSGTHMVGLIRIQFSADSPWLFYFYEQALIVLVLAILFYCAGLLFSKSRIRPVDVLGTVLLSRVPVLLVPLFRLIPFFDGITYQSNTHVGLLITYYGSVMWSAYLLFHAFEVSCNIKKPMIWPAYIVSMALSEMITGICINHLTN